MTDPGFEGILNIFARIFMHHRCLTSAYYIIKYLNPDCHHRHFHLRLDRIIGALFFTIIFNCLVNKPQIGRVLTSSPSVPNLISPTIWIILLAKYVDRTSLNSGQRQLHERQISPHSQKRLPRLYHLGSTPCHRLGARISLEWWWEMRFSS